MAESASEQERSRKYTNRNISSALKRLSSSLSRWFRFSLYDHAIGHPGLHQATATKGEEDCDKIISKIAVVCKKQSKDLVKAFPQQDRLGVTWAEVHRSRIRINQPISFRNKAKLTTKHHLIMLITSHFMFLVVIVIELTRSHIRTPT